MTVAAEARPTSSSATLEAELHAGASSDKAPMMESSCNSRNEERLVSCMVSLSAALVPWPPRRPQSGNAGSRVGSCWSDPAALLGPACSNQEEAASTRTNCESSQVVVETLRSSTSAGVVASPSGTARAAR